jgi:multidrug efflux pump subunit AcrA (membrane-fusion protein)
MSLGFLKKKKVYIPLIIVVLIVGLVVYGQIKKANQPPSYDTAKVTQGSLAQTVDATGKLEAVDNLALRFEIPGVIGQINVKEGDVVKAGTVLASLRLTDLNASVAQASANLNQRLAGSTNEDKASAQAQVDSAKASHDQVQVDVQNQINTAQAALDTAKNNLTQTQGGDNSQVVTQAYDTALVTIQSTLSKLDDALTQADNILGIDNGLANTSIRPYLSSANPGLLSNANILYLQAKTDRDQARQLIQSLSKTSPQLDIDRGLAIAQKSLNSMSTLLGTTSDILAASPPVGTLTQATLDGLKSTIQVSRTSVSAVAFKH